MIQDPESAQWNIDKLVREIEGKHILKPRCQRKKKWDKFPSISGKMSNYQDYIKFLYLTCHTIEVISMARKIENGTEIFMNIDGNNRINAIHYFYNHPLEIFNDNFQSIRENNRVFLNFLENIKYGELMQIRRLNRFIIDSNNIQVIESWNSFSQEFRETIESELEEVQIKLKVRGNNDFHLAVKVNLVIFNCSTDNELSKIFESINKHDNPLSKSDILAATLISATNFSIEDPHLNIEILQELDCYYDDKNDGEILLCYTSQNDIHYAINGNEFLIAFHNYCSRKYSFLQEFDGGQNDVFHKLYDFQYSEIGKDYRMFFKLEPEYFTTDNVSYFIEKIELVFSIIEKVMEKLFPKSIDIAPFKNIYPTFGKNILFILVLSILRLHFQNSIRDIEKIIIKILFYHFIIDSLDVEDRIAFRAYDDLYFSGGGGSIIIAKMIRFCINPELIGFRISKDKIEDALNKIMLKNVSSCLEKDKSRRKKVDNTFRILLGIYYNNKVPIEYTRRSQNIDHIIPFSSRWNDLLDVNRLGNMIVMDKEMNQKRGNKSIDQYYQDNPSLMATLNYPSIDEYNIICRHSGKNVEIIDNDAYNNIASRLEYIYCKTSLDFIF